LNPKRIAVAWIVTDVIWAIVFAVALHRHLRRRDATAQQLSRGSGTARIKHLEASLWAAWLCG
jgi:hypothetical protein